MAQAAVVTVSDGVSSGHREDDSGDALERQLAGAGLTVARRAVVADEAGEISRLLEGLCPQVRLIVTTGGTGLGPRDVTPEATRTVIDRPVPGLAEAMRATGRASTALADLSRGVVGAAGDTLIVNVPGSPAGATESLGAILEVVPHALDLLAGDTAHADDHGHGHDHDRDHGHDHGEGDDHGGTGTGSVPAVLADRVAAREPSVVATVLGVRGRPPSAAGRKLLVGPDGPLAGTLGCSDFDTLAVADTADVLADGGPRTTTYEHDLGTVEVLLEPHAPEPRVVAVGATPVARWLLGLAGQLGWDTVLVESRPERVTAAHRAAARRVLEAPRAGVIDDTTYLVHTDHDAPDAAGALAAGLRGGAAYVGIMGSGRHTAPHRDELRGLGFDDAAVERVESPVGLKLGGSDRAIAVGILAGLVRRGPDA